MSPRDRPRPLGISDVFPWPGRARGTTNVQSGSFAGTPRAYVADAATQAPLPMPVLLAFPTSVVCACPRLDRSIPEPRHRLPSVFPWTATGHGTRTSSLLHPPDLQVECLPRPHPATAPAVHTLARVPSHLHSAAAAAAARRGAVVPARRRTAMQGHRVTLPPARL
jgi:hypothetical protein